MFIQIKKSVHMPFLNYIHYSFSQGSGKLSLFFRIFDSSILENNLVDHPGYLISGHVIDLDSYVYSMIF